MRGFGARLAAATLALSLTPSVAGAVSDEPSGLTFSPELVGPGDLVTVQTTACGPAATAVVYPKSLSAPAALGPSLVPGRAEGTFRVLTSAEPGTYTVTGVCGSGKRIGGALKVPHSWIG